MVKTSLISILFLCIMSNSTNAQLTVNELSNMYSRLESMSNEFKARVEQFNQYSIELISQENLELTEEEKDLTIQEIQESNYSLSEIFDEFNDEYKSMYEEIEKDLPYVSAECVQYHHFFGKFYNYTEQIKTEFNSNIEQSIEAFKAYFGKENLHEIKGSGNEGKSVLKIITSFPILNSQDVVEFFTEQKEEDLTFLQKPVLTDKTIYMNQHKFMKKNKLDSLWDYYPTESSNAFFARHKKTKKVGFYEAGYDFDLNRVEEIFACEYDSIDFDPICDDWGIESWTTAIAFREGKYFVVEKSWKDEDSNQTVKKFSTNYSHLKIPDMFDHHAFGILIMRDTNDLWCLIDIDKDSIISPYYLHGQMVPGFNENGEIQKWQDRNDKVDVMYFADNTVDQFMGQNHTYEFYKNGQCRAASIKQKNGEYYDFKSYYDDGRVNAVGEIKNNSYFVNRLVVLDKEGNKYRSMQFDSTSLWIDSTFFPNGSLHSTGYQKNEYTGYLYNQEYLTTSLMIPYDYHRDSTWTFYYYSGQIKAKGTYTDNEKEEGWVYHNPFGEKTDNLYKRVIDTKMIFPYRILDLSKNTVKSVQNKRINLGIIYDYRRFNPPVYELWDTKNYRQLSGNYLIPLHGVNFLNDTVLVGGSLEYDGPHWYDIKNGELFFKEDIEDIRTASDGNPELNDTMDLNKDEFQIAEKLKINHINFSNGKIRIKEDSLVLKLDLHSGEMNYVNDTSQENALDTIYRKVYTLEELYYAQYYNQTMFVSKHRDKFIAQEEGGYVPSGNNRNEYSLVILENNRESQGIYIYDYYAQNKLIFENIKKKETLERYVKFEGTRNGDYVLYTPDNYYLGSKNIKDIVFFKQGYKFYEFEQFDLKYNRPDIILDRLGYADSSLIAAYHSAYKKRLKKMGFTEEMLEDDFHLPEIEIKNFEEMPNLIDDDKININLHMKDSKYKLDRINIWVNDVAIYGTDGITLRDLNTQKLDKTVKVNLAKGKNKVQVSVLNQAGAESYKETFEIICPKGKKKPDLYLVTIGESEFEQADYNLTYAAKDAKDIVGLFSNSKVYQSVMTKTLTNEQVTRENVLDLKAFLKKADINDHVMIFIAGHGVLSADLDYYLATYDMDFQNPAAKGLMYQDLEGLLDGIKPLKKTLILDACHSGEIDKEEVELVASENTTNGEIKFRAVGKNVKSKLGAQNTLELTRSLFTDLRKGTGSTVISSAGGMEFAMEGEEWNNGLFTYALIEGVETGKADLNEDGEIWMSELQEYVSNQVTKLSNGNQQPTSRIENQVVDFRVW